MKWKELSSVIKNTQVMWFNLGDIIRSPDEKRLQFSKMSRFDMIIINIGLLIYPVKDSVEMGIVFSKYRFSLFHLGSQINFEKENK